MCCPVLAAARILQGPDNVGAQVGSRVQLKCMFHHRSCREMMWARVEQSSSTELLYLGRRMRESYGDRYSVNVSQRGECTLNIIELHLSDAGPFTCSDLSDDSKKTAVITVIGMCFNHV